MLLDVSMKIWAIVLKEKIIEINQEIIIERLLVTQEVSDNLDSLLHETDSVNFSPSLLSVVTGNQRIRSTGL